MPDPVHVGLRGQGGVDRPDGEIFRIDIHLSVQDGGGHERLGVEAEGVGLAAVHLEAVHKVIVVERVPEGACGGGYIQVENRDLTAVEVGFQQIRARELTENVILLEAGDPARLDDFLVHIGVQRVVFPRDRFGNHDGNVGLARHGGSVPVVHDEAQMPLQEGLLDDVLRLGGVHLDLAVQAGLPRIGQFRVMPFPGLVQAVQDGPDIAVVRLDQGGLQLPQVLFQHEIDLREGAFGNLLGFSLVSDQMGRQRRDVVGAGFQRIAAFQVRGDADDRPVEIDAGERNRLARFRVTHGTAHPRRLGGCHDGQSQEQDGKKSPFHGYFLTRTRFAW